MKYNIKTLIEKNRRELLQKQKREAPKRVKRADAYSVSSIKIDPNAFINDWCVITTQISGNGSSYTDSIAFQNILSNLIATAKNDSSHVVNSKLILKSIKESLDKEDIYIDCTCPDFKFTYAYFATKDKFKWGKLQSSNGKEIRNPNNDKGSMCKHLYALLRSNNFLNAISDKIMRILIANLDVIYNKFKFDLSEFKINVTAYDKLLKANISRDKKGKFISTTNKENIEDDESNDKNKENL